MVEGHLNLKIFIIMIYSLIDFKALGTGAAYDEISSFGRYSTVGELVARNSNIVHGQETFSLN